MGKIVKGIFKGILVLLALSTLVFQSTKVHAGNSSSTQEVPAIKPIVLIISVVDGVAFTEADTDSLKRYLKKILPRNDIIHINAVTSVEFSNIPLPHQIIEVRKNIEAQIKEKISDRSKISHLVLMDHGNTSLDKNARTIFRYLGTFGVDGGDKAFRKIFDPLVGRFTNDATLVMESCSTVCDGVKESQNRIQVLMNYFKIKSGTVFGAYHDMLSEGYEMGFYLKQAGGQIVHPYTLIAALQIALATQIDVLFTSSHFSILEFTAAFLGTTVIAPAIAKFVNYLNKKMDKYNWGFLYKFRSGNLDRVYDVNYYENKNDLFLKLNPNRFKGQIFTCSSLFN